MIIEYDPEEKLVYVDGIPYFSTFNMPTALRDEFSAEDWLSINQFLNWAYNDKDYE